MLWPNKSSYGMRALICLLAFGVTTSSVADEPAAVHSLEPIGTSANRPDSAAEQTLANETLQPGYKNCPDIAARTRSTRLSRALEGGFGVQYWGDQYSAEGLSAQPHGLLIIEAAKIGALYSETGREVFFSREEVEQISIGGTRPVLGYLNVGEIENYRDYWIDYVAERTTSGSPTVPDWFGPHHGHGDHLAAYWVQEWRDLLFERVDRLMRSGATGVFLDDVLQYYSYAADDLTWPGEHRDGDPTTAPELARAMMQLVVDVAGRVRAWDCEAFVVVNNAVFIGRDAAESAEGDGSRPIFDAYLSAIDAIMVENLFAPSTHANTRSALIEDFKDNGVKIMTIDVLSRYGSDDLPRLRQSLSQAALDAGFNPYISDDEAFNRLSAPILPSEKS